MGLINANSSELLQNKSDQVPSNKGGNQGKEKNRLKYSFSVAHQKCAIHTVLHQEAATREGERRRRPEAPQPRRRLLPDSTRGSGRAGVETALQPGRDKWQGGTPESHLHFPFRTPFSDHPRNPSPERERLSLSPPAGSKFIGLSQLSGPPGFVVRPSGPSHQGRRPEEPLNYNPHNAPRAHRSRPLSHPLSRSTQSPPPRKAPASPAAGAGVWLSTQAPHHRLSRWPPPHLGFIT
ncbi:unnamed protein product [Rangifer tarandus platyrhynchus]|uniref:Uncharacterized protein n=1 Tax=Rangifer tarandus platyrhynchus TaxID=3082113 RepID=A0ABN8ZXC8_RANTA|nr:unnamed protein product [Rangifer tarandus platyrhynchus]